MSRRPLRPTSRLVLRKALGAFTLLMAASCGPVLAQTRNPPPSRPPTIALPPTWPTRISSTSHVPLNTPLPTRSPSQATLTPFSTGEYLLYSKFLGKPEDPFLRQVTLAPIRNLAASHVILDGYSAQASPDGRLVAFIDGAGAWAFNLATTEMMPLELAGGGETPVWHTCSRPVWAPDSSMFVTSCGWMDKPNMLFEFILLTRTGGSVPGTDSCLAPTFSPSGKVVMAACYNATGVLREGDGLRAIDLASGIQTLVPDCESRMCNQPIWSPSGELVAVIIGTGRSSEPPAWAGLYLVPAGCYWQRAACEGSAVGPVASSGTYVWAPDGNEIAFARDDKLASINTATGKSMEYDQPFGHVANLLWSPSGEWIAVDDPSSKTIFIVDSTLTGLVSTVEGANLSAESWLWIR